MIEMIKTLFFAGLVQALAAAVPRAQATAALPGQAAVVPRAWVVGEFVAPAMAALPALAAAVLVVLFVATASAPALAAPRG